MRSSRSRAESSRMRSPRSGWLGEVVAVGFDRLAEQRDLAHAVDGEVGDFADDFVHGAALLAAAAVGDDAVGAELVAAVDHRHEGGRAFGDGVGGGPELAAEVLGRGLRPAP